MNLEQELLDRAGSRIAAEIDFGVLCGMLESIGWKRVVLSPMTSERSDAIDFWLLKNSVGKYNTMGLVWIFENQGDAVNFTLKWAN
jgi:hypothetical protein